MPCHYDIIVVNIHIIDFSDRLPRFDADYCWYTLADFATATPADSHWCWLRHWPICQLYIELRHYFIAAAGHIHSFHDTQSYFHTHYAIVDCWLYYELFAAAPLPIIIAADCHWLMLPLSYVYCITLTPLILIRWYAITHCHCHCCHAAAVIDARHYI